MTYISIREWLDQLQDPQVSIQEIQLLKQKYKFELVQVCLISLSLAKKKKIASIWDKTKPIVYKKSFIRR